MRDSWQDFNAFTQNASNRAASFSAGASSSLGQYTAPFSAALDSAIERVDPDGSRSEGIGKFLGDLALYSSPIPTGVRAWLESRGFGNDPADRFVQGWHQELLNIMAGGQVNRAGLVARPRPQQVVRAGANAVGRANAALRAPVGAVEWNQRQGLPGIILP
jgi:hypothetical protein